MRLTGTISRLIGGRAAGQVLAVLLLIEAVFVAESLQGVLEDVLSNQGSWLDAARIMALTVPEIFDFALPLALVIGIYSALVTAREENEFVVCSAAGMSWNRISGFVAMIGIAGFVLSLAVAGYLNPLAATVKRAMLWDLQARLVLKRIVDPGERDGLQTIDEWTFISTGAGREDRERGHLFVHHPFGESGWRVTQADDWTLAGPNPDRSYTVTFKTVMDYQSRNLGFPAEGADTAKGDRPAPAEPPSFSAVRADGVSVPIHLEKLMRQADEARRNQELSFTEVMGRVATGDATNDGALRRAGELVGRALLCPIAALLALCAVIMARNGTVRYVALPAAAVGTLAFDTLSRAVLGQAAVAGMGPLLLWSLVLAAGAAVPLAIFILGRGERIVAPAYGRA